MAMAAKKGNIESWYNNENIIISSEAKINILSRR
jgi:hypothetical protein